jgi:phosphatidylglycerol:prolipoprotein diacylglycerol transferase
MIGLIPFAIPPWTARVYHLGPIPIDPWMTLVCVGIIIGLEISRARGIKLGLDTRDVVDGAAFTVICGFIGGHLLHVLGYHPERLETEGWISLVKIWTGYSSMGGFVGAVIGFLIFFTYIRPRPRWVHADTLIFGFPIAQMFGRLGCVSVHDHVGAVTSFPLGISFEPGQLTGIDGARIMEASVRHDPALYEAIVCLIIGLVFFYLAKKPRPSGFFIGVWCLMYAPVRFSLDFMRAAGLKADDVRYFGLTPAQYITLSMVVFGLYLLVKMSRKNEAVPEQQNN